MRAKAARSTRAGLSTEIPTCRSKRNYSGGCGFRLEHREKKQVIKRYRIPVQGWWDWWFSGALTAFLLPYTEIIDSMRIRKGRRNSRLRQPLQCRGDWIRTSDLLNPIQQVASKKGRFSEPFRNLRFPSITNFTRIAAPSERSTPGNSEAGRVRPSMRSGRAPPGGRVLV